MVYVKNIENYIFLFLSHLASTWLNINSLKSKLGIVSHGYFQDLFLTNILIINYIKSYMFEFE